MGQDMELFQMMVGYLASDGQRWMKDLKAAFQTLDVPRIQQRAHSLKGLISNFGSGRAWRAASSMEDLAGRQDRGIDEQPVGAGISLRGAHGGVRPFLAANTSS